MNDAKQMVDALVRERHASSIAATAVLGGLALVAGFAVRALQGGPKPPSRQGSAAPTAGENAAPITPFDHSGVSEDEARIMLRAMVAAIMADGLMDAEERRRLDKSLAAAGISGDARAWLAKELTEPADIDELTERISSPEQAIRIYAAARLAIDPDTLQERQFLKMLAEALDVPSEAAARLDAELADEPQGRGPGGNG
ncbi:tellurite resistance TerB family protein [Methylobacterium nigriterrae]|uniref:tellurite resistance TerB family protein n=1 Tax=Methylobacterium nigriterrae TaxID=3127512 RepID=UPI0030138C16